MKNTGNKRHLETFKIFPYVAWGLVISFSLFVYGISQNLKTVTEELHTNTAFLESTANTPIEDIKSFER